MKDILYHATIRYYRSWLSFDGVWSKYIKSKSGKLDSHAFRAITNEYKVARCVKKKSEPNGLVDALNGKIVDWPSSPENILERQKFCTKFTDENRKFFSQRKGNGIWAGSLVTKLVWFLRPDGWTVFDSYASKGIGLKSSLKTRCKMREFYEKLDQAGFHELQSKMQSRIGEATKFDFPAARIIDLALMLKGGFVVAEAANNGFDIIESLPEQNEAFLTVLHYSTSKNLIDLAKLLQNEFGSKEIFIS